ncbi:MAG TPA: MmgE/PrpD family protein [Xanthobacteraceae bacterium]|jgi:2-methylcitrate dehydratase PrpD
MTPLETLAAWASALRPADIPAEQHGLARLRLLDTLGLIAAASAEPVCRSTLQWAESYSGGGSATIIVAGRRASLAIAALVHGTLAHARDFDDTFPASVVHPGSVVVPAALGVGEQTGAGFPELTAAIVLGYEIAARLGQVAGRGFHVRGFHATGIVGPIAAAATAAHLLKLDAAATADALGLATSMSGGLMAFLADGAWSKWLHTGWSAHGGIIAAELARAAFRGPHHGLDHAFGLFGAFLGDDPTRDYGSLTQDLGMHWRGAAALPKLYPCAHVIHPFIDAALALRSKGEAKVDQIRSIRCTVAPWAYPIVCAPREAKLAPRTDLDAIASLPFMLAAALCDGAINLDTLRPAALRRDDVLQLAARIECDTAESLGAGFDGVIRIIRPDGEIVQPVALAAADADRVRRKFHSNAAYLYAPAAADALAAVVLEGEPGAREIMRLASAAARIDGTQFEG